MMAEGWPSLDDYGLCRVGTGSRMTTESAAEIEAHRDLVERVVRRLVSELDLSCDQDDLRGYGFQGLLEAKQRFEPDRGVRFSTFAYYRVRGAMLDGVRMQGWMKRRAYAKLKAFEATDDVAESVGDASADKPQQSVAARAAAIDDVLSKVSAAYMIAAVGQDRVEDESTPETLLSGVEEQTTVKRNLARLPDKERALLESVYFDGVTIEQAGERMGLSKSWASRLHAKALERMRKSLTAEERA